MDDIPVMAVYFYKTDGNEVHYTINGEELLRILRTEEDVDNLGHVLIEKYVKLLHASSSLGDVQNLYPNPHS